MTNDAAVAYMTGSWNMRPFVTKMDFGGDETLLHETAKQMHWVPLYSATTVAELRAEIADRNAVIECKNIDIRERDRALHEWAERADAAERRVAELEAGAQAVVLAFEALGQSRGIVADRAAHRQCEATLVTLKSLYTLRQEKPE